MIVHTGGGVHVYFTLSRVLTRTEWQPLAHALAEAGKRHGLKADYQVTIDSARLLRIPGTENNKQETPRPVTLGGKPLEFDCTVERLWEALEPYKPVLRVAHAPKLVLDPLLFPPRSPLPDGVAEELGAGISRREFDPIHLDDLAVECAFIRDAIATGGLMYTNPMWNLTSAARPQPGHNQHPDRQRSGGAADRPYPYRNEQWPDAARDRRGHHASRL